MRPINQHPWNFDVNEAQRLQIELAQRVECETRFDGDVRWVAGVDVAYHKDSQQLVAAIVLLDAESLTVVDSAVHVDQSEFPYIPGLFSFRELPPLIKAFEKLHRSPDLVVCDGQGYAHPRRFGLACHLGVLFDIPTIGCGKTHLLGQYTEPDLTRGSMAELVDQEERIGSVLRTQNKVKPVFVSCGHRISLNDACTWVLKLTPKYRLPETTRQADQWVKQKLKEIG